MPECIVCKGNREAGRPCRRCGSDNSVWDRWRATHVEERGGLEGLLAFSEPHFYLPFLITALALPLGLMGMAGIWRGVLPAAQLLAVAVTVSACLLAAFAGYGARHEIREEELLSRVRRGRAALLGGVRFRAIVVPAFSLFFVLLIACAMVVSDLSWELAKWLLLDPEYVEQLERQEALLDITPEGEQPEAGDGMRRRIGQVFPFVLMGLYVAFMISFTYSASLQLALHYAQEMNRELPQPIFLREDLLTEVVRREAERVVCRPITPTVIGGQQAPGGAKQELGSWTWDEMERRDDGGITLRAIVRAGNKTEESLTGERTESPVYNTYVVEADPWSRITKVARAKEPEGEK
jgi:hypothetical protein